MKIYENTGVKCYICNEELKLIEDITYNDFNGDLLKDVEHYFECPNGCDGEYETIDDYDDVINKIIIKNIPKW